MRLDVKVSQIAGVSRNKALQLIESGAVKVDGKVVKKKSLDVNEDAQILVSVNKNSQKLTKINVYQQNLTKLNKTSQKLTDLPSILFEDEYVVIVNKPAGLITEPGDSVRTLTLQEMLVDAGKIAPETESGGVVSRLDKGTSGVILFAKTDVSFDAFKAMYADRKMHKTYLVLANGKVANKKFRVDAPIARDKKNRIRFSVSRDGKEAVTDFDVVQEYEKFTLLKAFPKTGRTHQIRVHLASIGHAVIGDKLYGDRSAFADTLDRNWLHSAALEFLHPISDEKVIAESKLPSELEEVFSVLE
ncbi:MAG: RluA family pseudouridine synthase [Bifidobacteriaceae bacterium]|jgi:23S rRNA pseudouridine1911/1915/1917 synthase|nr:RluA family pseudouridine synthase [Bifidobacteriaceae bacterium]